MKIKNDIKIILIILSVLIFISTSANNSKDGEVKVNKIKDVSNEDNNGIKLINIDQNIDNALIQKQYKNFENYTVKRFLYRYDKLKPVIEMMKKILSENGISPDLVYLSYIESEFLITAKSHRNAVGLWQFASYTAKELGLNINRYVDERKDIYKSTLAFVKHFKFLYNYYGSIDLALAAYNCGVGRLNKAIKMGKTKDFWELAQKGLVPKETKYYVPKFYAVVKWANEHNDILEPINYENLIVVKVNQKVKISTIFNLKDKVIKNQFYKYNKHIYSSIIHEKSYLVIPQKLLWERNNNFNKLNIVYYFIPDIFEMKLSSILESKNSFASIDDKTVSYKYFLLNNNSGDKKKNIKE